MKIVALFLSGLAVLFSLLLPVQADPPAAAPPTPAPVKNPAILILGSEKLDYDYLTELHKKGFNFAASYAPKEKTLTWDWLKQFNCLLLTNLPQPAETAPGQWDLWYGPPHRREFLELLQRYMADGGGVLLLLNTSRSNTTDGYQNNNFYLGQWGAKLTLEQIFDPQTETAHPRSRAPFIYTDQIAPSPVSAKVRGIWYPNTAHSGNCNFEIWGQPIEVSKDWTEVVKGSGTSYSEAMKPGFALRGNEHFTPYVRPGKVMSPTLFAIREFGGGRMGLAALNDVFHIVSGTSWVHDRVMLGKGMGNRPSDFDVLLENTLRWMAEPSLANGKLGGWQQDPLVLTHPNYRKKADEFFPRTQVPEPPAVSGKVFRGLIGARTAYSSGSGTVADYAAAAQRADLQFVIFLEEFSRCNEANFRKLEADCKALSTDALLLVPGYTIDNNIGNHMFFYGYDGKWPTPSQLDGPAKDQLRTQCYDKDGKLTYNDEDAKNLLWGYAGSKDGRNIGFYNFAGSKPGALPVRNLRLFGMLAVVSYEKGKQLEDLTPEYLQFMKDGNPPLAGAVDLVSSPAELEAAVQAGHYLTHVTADSVKGILGAIPYGHQYGRANVNPSQGPEIKAWSGARIMTYAGEPFVSPLYRYRPLVWVTSAVGLKEIKIWCDEKVWRRFLCNGEKEFKQVFEWCYDRQRNLVLEVTDTAGRRALSVGQEVYGDAGYNGWCHDRQNGELWHGPFMLAGPRRPLFSQGITWDGGGSECFIGLDYGNGPTLRTKGGEVEGLGGRIGGGGMEGDTYATCFDGSVANIAGNAFNVYAPGLVVNAYQTLGPIQPSRLMTVSLRRTQYLHRIAGPDLTWHTMMTEREGGNLALMEGAVILKKDADLEWPGLLDLTCPTAANFPPDSPNLPLYVIRTDNATPPICGPQDGFCWMHGIFKGLGRPEAWTFTIQPGGYVAVFATQLGNSSILANVGDTPLNFDPRAPGAFTYPVPNNGQGKAGDVYSWKLLMIYDSMKQRTRNLNRIESIWKYFGLDGKHDSGLLVKRGKLLKHFGLVDLAPDNGIVEFELPPPPFELDIPLGLRISGFNPNWTIGQFQIEGYSPGFYSNGRNVYRNLATDDRDLVHLAVYTTGVAKTRCVVGHPVQCDAKDLIIELTRLQDAPPQYHVAVNNPTDQPIATVLKKTMDLPGFDFPDTPVQVPAGGYQVVREK